jgi:membrane protease YdiL (CAAX protease family)
MTGLAGAAGIGPVAARRAGPPGHGVWRWTRWTRWPISGLTVALALATVIVDVMTAWLDIDIGQLGRVPISPALPLGVLLAAMVGFRRLGFDRANLWAWREFLIGSGIALLFGIIVYTVQMGGSTEAFGLVVAALGEELVYRLAVLIVVGVVCAALLGRNWRNAEDWGTGPGVVAIAAAGIVFAFLPGHVAQMSDTFHALPFVSLGIVLGYVVLRTGALLPAALVHALLNLATIAADTGHAPVMLRTALSAAALLALLAGTIVAGWRLGILRKVETADTT